MRPVLASQGRSVTPPDTLGPMAQRGRPKVLKGEVERFSISVGDEEREALALMRARPGREEDPASELVRAILLEWRDSETLDELEPDRPD